jgi:hypothetical protein
MAEGSSLLGGRKKRGRGKRKQKTKKKKKKQKKKKKKKEQKNTLTAGQYTPRLSYHPQVAHDPREFLPVAQRAVLAFGGLFTAGALDTRTGRFHSSFL